MDLERFLTELGRCADLPVAGATAERVGGGSINQAFRVTSEQGSLFAKVGAPSSLGMFEAEARGLQALRRAGGVRVPMVVGTGALGGAAYLLLEWLELGPKTAEAERRLGRGLAALHRTTSASFGWDYDNTIGSTPQINTPNDEWIAFFRERRLRYQLELAERNGLPAPVLASGVRLLKLVEELLAGHRPVASLLHGDLWGGNWGVDAGGTPVIFDPAVYFGDREADLAMTRLFGGFGPAFYAAYDDAWPLETGWKRRVDLYNVYHLLNHFNLFGAGYLESVRSTIDGLVEGNR